MKMIKSILLKAAKVLSVSCIIGMLIPQDLKMPVAGATHTDYNQNSYWAYPWGTSVTHKGVDVFASKGTRLNSATKGIVLKSGTQSKGGKYVLVLGPKWRIHYYAHLHSINCKAGQFVDTSKQIGTVGNSGNAVNKPDHLHYVIASLIPYTWKIDNSIQGWKKMFYLNPIEYLQNRA